MRSYLRTALIRHGIGRQFFLSSWNPVVRAHAVCANYKARRINAGQLAEHILRDCFDVYNLNEDAAQIYAELIREVKLAEEAKAVIRDQIQETVVRIDSVIFRDSATQLMRMLGLLPRLGVVKK